MSRSLPLLLFPCGFQSNACWASWMNDQYFHFFVSPMYTRPHVCQNIEITRLCQPPELKTLCAPGRSLQNQGLNGSTSHLNTHFKTTEHKIPHTFTDLWPTIAMSLRILLKWLSFQHIGWWRYVTLAVYSSLLTAFLILVTSVSAESFIFVCVCADVEWFCNSKVLRMRNGRSITLSCHYWVQQTFSRDLKCS